MTPTDPINGNTSRFERRMARTALGAIVALITAMVASLISEIASQ